MCSRKDERRGICKIPRLGSKLRASEVGVTRKKARVKGQGAGQGRLKFASLYRVSRRSYRSSMTFCGLRGCFFVFFFARARVGGEVM